MATARSLRNVRRNRIGGGWGGTRYSPVIRFALCLTINQNPTAGRGSRQCTRRLRGAILVWEIWLHAGSIEGGREKGRCDGQGRRGGAETQVVSAKHAGAFEDIAYEPYSDRFDPADPTWRRGRLLLRRTRRRRWAGRFAAARPYRLALFWKSKLASAREFLGSAALPVGGG